MKVVCDRGALLDAVSLVSGVVAARTPRPVLRYVLLKATTSDAGSRLAFAATDGEVSLQFSTDEVEVREPGEALLPADKIRAIVAAEDTEATVELETEGDTCVVKAGRDKYTLMGYPAKEFPTLPDFADAVAGTADVPPAKSVFAHDSGALNAMITRTVFATAKENSRYAINGVLMKRDGKTLEMVATDGRRLAFCRSKVKGDKDAAPVTAIVPTKALSLLQKLLGNEDEPLEMAVGESRLYIGVGGSGGKGHRATIATNLVEGTFPPYEEVIPRDQDKKVTFDRDSLASAVHRAALLTNEESRGVRMAFSGGDKQLQLSSRAPEVGDAHIEVDLAGYEGEDIEIGFNPAFISDALRVIPETEIILELKSPAKPGLIRAGSDFQYVVMPVNLQ